MFVWRKGVPQSAGMLAAAFTAGVVLVAGPVYWSALRSPATGIFHDDGIYLVTAQALATGHGYRITSLPAEIAQTKYPFVFPALLAAVWKIHPRFPENVLALKLVPFACALVWAALTYRLLRGHARNRRAPAVLIGLVSLSPWVFFLSTTLLSETLFAAGWTGALLILERAERGEGGAGTAAGAALLAGAVFLTRTAGIAVMAGGVLVLWRQRRWKQVLVFVLVGATVAAPWLWWQAAQSPPAGHDAYYSRANYRDWNLVFGFTPAQKARILLTNLVSIWIAPAVLAGVPATGWGVCMALLGGAVVAAGFARRLSRGARAMEVSTILYAGIVVLWAWPPTRLLVPVLPLMLFYGYEGMVALGRSVELPPGAARAALASVVLMFAAQGAWALRHPGAPGLPIAAQDGWPETARMLAWAKAHTPQDAILAGNLDPAYYLFTGRKSIRGFTPDPYLLHYAAEDGARPLGSAEDFLRTLDSERVTHLICAPNRAFREGPPLARLSAELVERHPERLRPVYASRDGDYRIYALTSGVPDAQFSLTPNLQASPPMLASK